MEVTTDSPGWVDAARVVAATLLALGGVHLYWALGGRAGRDAAVPEVDGRPVLEPTPTATVGVAVALALGALVVVTRAGLWAASPLPPRVAYSATWALAILFLLRAVGDFRLVGFTKRVRGTAFAWWDTRLYSPLCTVLGIGLLWIAVQ